MAAVAAAGGAALLHAAPRQQSTPARQPEPHSFEFLALGTDGRPVVDLDAADIDLRLDGRLRTLRELIWVPQFDPRTADGKPAQPLPPPFGTNQAQDGVRTLLLVIDDYSFRPGRERPLREAVDRFLARLAPRDRVALVTIPYGGLKTDLTTEHERVLVELAKVGGQLPDSETGSDLACRTRRTLETLMGLLESLRGGEGPTLVLFFSSRLAGPRRDAFATLPPGACELPVDHFNRVGAAASSARAIFYIVQPDDVMLNRDSNQTETIAGTGFRGSDNPLEGLEHLAGVTGGHRLHLLAPDDDSLERITRETTGYYVVRFDQDRSDREGAFRQVQVRVNRPEVVVRARPTFAVPRVGPRGEAPTPASMLRDGRVYRTLPLRAGGYVSRSATTDKVKVVAIVEPLDPSARLASVAGALFDGNGRAVAQWTAGDPDARPLAGAFEVAEGLYRLRIAATDTSGRAGTADYEVRAELGSAGPLTVSGLVLGLSRTTGFVPRMEFGPEPVASAFLELYGQTGTAALSVAVTFEVARTLNGPALVSTPGVIESTRAADRYAATGAIPIASLPPGDYIVRAITSVQGHASGRVMRTLRKIQP
jgi:VWFA-related protein